MRSVSPPLEMRAPPSDASLRAQAAANPGGWVYDIDYPYTADQHVPPEAIRGAWEVTKVGTLSGNYAPNNRYRPIKDVERPLKPYMHAAALHNPDQWIAEIAPAAEGHFPDIPETHIAGWWLVDSTGKLTRKFRANSLFDPKAPLTTK